MNKYSRNTAKSTKDVPQKTQNKKTKILTVILTFTILCNLFQANIFALEKDNVFENELTTQSTDKEITSTTDEEPTGEEPTGEEPTSEEPASEAPTSEEPASEAPTSEEPASEEPASEEPASEEPASEEPASEEPASEEPKSEQVENEAIINTVLAADLPLSTPSTFSLATFAAAPEQFRITYYSNYPAGSGLTDSTYLDPLFYENNANGNAAYLSQTGFVTPENYYFVGWNPAPNAGTAQYPEGGYLSEIDNNWNLYAIYMPYKTLNWTIADSSYTSDYNAQSHTNAINWPTAVSAAWAGESISGLTYSYSVNGGAFSSTKPTLVDAGNYTITVKASAPRYTEITTTVSVQINKAPLKIYPNISGAHAFGSLSTIAYSIPSVNAANGPKSQSDENTINSAIAASTPLFDVLDNSNIVISDLQTALPGQYTVNINGTTLASLQSNSAFSNYILSADSASFSITSLNSLTVSAKALNTVYSATSYDAVSDITSSVPNAKIEYSIDNAPFSTSIPNVKNAGSYKVEIRASAPGYESTTITLTAIIEKRDATLNIATHSKVFGIKDPTLVANFSGLQGSDKIDYTLKRTAGEAVGDYVVTADVVSNSNYNIIINNGLLTITPAPVVPVPPTEEPDTTVPPTEEPDTTVPPTEEPETTVPPTTPGTTVPPTTPGTTTVVPETTVTPVVTTPEIEPTEAQELETTEVEEISLVDTELPSANGADTQEASINETELPLATGNGAWALLNLILTIVTAFISIALVIGYFAGKQNDSEEENSDDIQIKRKGFARFASIAVAIISIVVFLLTQDMRLKMVIVDSWTIVMVVITFVQVIISFLAKKVREVKN